MLFFTKSGVRSFLFYVFVFFWPSIVFVAEGKPTMKNEVSQTSNIHARIHAIIDPHVSIKHPHRNRIPALNLRKKELQILGGVGLKVFLPAELDGKDGTDGRARLISLTNSHLTLTK